MANGSILLVLGMTHSARLCKGSCENRMYQLKELALLEEENSIVMILLDLPELGLERSKRFPCCRWDVESARVVLGVPRTVAVGLNGHVSEDFAAIMDGPTHILRINEEAEHLLIGHFLVFGMLCKY